MRKPNTRQRSIEAKGARPAAPSRRWSARVTEHSDALDLQAGVFRLKEPKSIARSLKRSAEHSARRKASPYRSALSMLVFYINRAGKNLPAARRKHLGTVEGRVAKAVRQLQCRFVADAFWGLSLRDEARAGTNFGGSGLMAYQSPMCQEAAL